MVIIYGLGLHHTTSVRNRPRLTPAPKYSRCFTCLLVGTACQKDLVYAKHALEVVFATHGCRQRVAQAVTMTYATVYIVYAVGFFSL